MLKAPRRPRNPNQLAKLVGEIQTHECAVALRYMHYNFGRIHKTLRVTPAMQAGIADHVWTFEEIAELAN